MDNKKKKVYVSPIIEKHPVAVTDVFATIPSFSFEAVQGEIKNLTQQISDKRDSIPPYQDLELS